MIACRSCGGDRLEQVLDLGEQPWGNDFIRISEQSFTDNYPLGSFTAIHVPWCRLTTLFQKKRCSLIILICLEQQNL